MVYVRVVKKVKNYLKKVQRGQTMQYFSTSWSDTLSTFGSIFDNLEHSETYQTLILVKVSLLSHHHLFPGGSFEAKYILIIS